MARIRSIKPEYWQDEKLAPLPPIDRLVFLGLISQADDAGRLVDSVRLLDGLLFPHTDDSCAASLEVLTDLGVIERGVTASGQSVIQIVNWHHQKIDKPNLTAALPSIAIDRHPRRVPMKLRQAIFERDAGICRSCGAETHLDKGHPRYGGDDFLAEIDHVKALADGGDNDPANLQLLCKKCNRQKAGIAATQRLSTSSRNVGDESTTDRRPISVSVSVPVSVPTTSDQLSAREAATKPNGNGAAATAELTNEQEDQISQAIIAANTGMAANPKLREPRPILRSHPSRQYVADWLLDGIRFETISDVVHGKAKEATQPVYSMAYFDKPVREAHESGLSSAYSPPPGSPASTFTREREKHIHEERNGAARNSTLEKATAEREASEPVLRWKAEHPDETNELQQAIARDLGAESWENLDTFQRVAALPQLHTKIRERIA